jgi:hypothetical protein
VRLPTVIASSVIRTSQQGESHGGLYLVDLETGKFEQVLDWNDGSISWEGRGAERGLRGIAVCQDKVYLAASDELFVYDRDFNLLQTFKNRYLSRCHEICVSGNALFLTSTLFDSVLTLDLKHERFGQGFCFRGGLSMFNPGRKNGPKAGDTLHLNNAFYTHGYLYVAGSWWKSMVRIQNGGAVNYASLPKGTHNARPFRRGILYNFTARNQIIWANRSGEVLEAWKAPSYPKAGLENQVKGARQSWARGLCTKSNLIIGRKFTGHHNCLPARTTKTVAASQPDYGCSQRNSWSGNLGGLDAPIYSFWTCRYSSVAVERIWAYAKPGSR